MDGEKPADFFKISEMGLFPGKEIRYLFNFGDNWEFMVTVLDIEPGAKVAGKYKVLKKIGKSPKQYPNWDDDDED
jgi:hypothetical protein